MRSEADGVMPELQAPAVYNVGSAVHHARRRHGTTAHSDDRDARARSARSVQPPFILDDGCTRSNLTGRSAPRGNMFLS
jgi:hypothetical protein